LGAAVFSIQEFSILCVALLKCGSAFFALLGALMALVGLFLQVNSKQQIPAQGPVILQVIGAPLALVHSIVLLFVASPLAKEVLVLPAREMVQLGGSAALLGLALITLGVGLILALARAFAKNESVVFFPVAAFLAGGLTLLSGLSSTALGLLA
jgi:uncharacterized protein YhhL (DUF1145 family)